MSISYKSLIAKQITYGKGKFEVNWAIMPLGLEKRNLHDCNHLLMGWNTLWSLGHSRDPKQAIGGINTYF